MLNGMSLLSGKSREVSTHKTLAEQEPVKQWSSCHHDNDLGDICKVKRSCYVSKERAVLLYFLNEHFYEDRCLFNSLALLYRFNGNYASMNDKLLFI